MYDELGSKRHCFCKNQLERAIIVLHRVYIRSVRFVMPLIIETMHTKQWGKNAKIDADYDAFDFAAASRLAFSILT